MDIVSFFFFILYILRISAGFINITLKKKKYSEKKIRVYISRCLEYNAIYICFEIIINLQ